MMRHLVVLLLLAAGCGVVDSRYYERLLRIHADAGEDDAGSEPDAGPQN